MVYIWYILGPKLGAHASIFGIYWGPNQGPILGAHRKKFGSAPFCLAALQLRLPVAAGRGFRQVRVLGSSQADMVVSLEIEGVLEREL